MIKWLNNNNAKKDIKEAKKLFFDFGTSKYQMLREDVLSTYQSYGITPEQEAKWIKELLNFELNQFDTSDLNSIFPLVFVIENNADVVYLKKFAQKTESQLHRIENQYFAVTIGRTLFDLIDRISRGERNPKTQIVFDRDVKIFCIGVVKKLVDKALMLNIPSDYHIPYFTTISEGLTQQQFTSQKIIGLQEDINKALILL